MTVRILDDSANRCGSARLHLDLRGLLETGEVRALRGLHSTLLHLADEVSLHFGKGRAANDVISVLGLNDGRDLTRLERRSSLVELFDHRAAREDSERS